MKRTFVLLGAAFLGMTCSSCQSYCFQQKTKEELQVKVVDKNGKGVAGALVLIGTVPVYPSGPGYTIVRDFYRYLKYKDTPLLLTCDADGIARLPEKNPLTYNYKEIVMKKNNHLGGIDRLVSIDSSDSPNSTTNNPGGVVQILALSHAQKKATASLLGIDEPFTHLNLPLTLQLGDDYDSAMRSIEYGDLPFKINCFPWTKSDLSNELQEKLLHDASKATRDSAL